MACTLSTCFEVGRGVNVLGGYVMVFVLDTGVSQRRRSHRLRSKSQMAGRWTKWIGELSAQAHEGGYHYEAVAKRGDLVARENGMARDERDWPGRAKEPQRPLYLG